MRKFFNQHYLTFDARVTQKMWMVSHRAEEPSYTAGEVYVVLKDCKSKWRKP